MREIRSYGSVGERQGNKSLYPEILKFSARTKFFFETDIASATIRELQSQNLVLCVGGFDRLNHRRFELVAERIEKRIGLVELVETGQ